MAKFVNLTPHTINLVVGDKNPTTLNIPPSGMLARVEEARVLLRMEEHLINGEVVGVPIIAKKFGEVYGLPNPEAGTIYIVSALVATAAKRDDTMCPGDPIRDTEGRVIGCAALCAVV